MFFWTAAPWLRHDGLYTTRRIARPRSRYLGRNMCCRVITPVVGQLYVVWFDFCFRILLRRCCNIIDCIYFWVNSDFFSTTTADLAKIIILRTFFSPPSHTTFSYCITFINHPLNSTSCRVTGRSRVSTLLLPNSVLLTMSPSAGESRRLPLTNHPDRLISARVSPPPSPSSRFQSYYVCKFPVCVQSKRVNDNRRTAPSGGSRRNKPSFIIITLRVHTAVWRLPFRLRDRLDNIIITRDSPQHLWQVGSANELCVPKTSKSLTTSVGILSWEFVFFLLFFFFILIMICRLDE